MKSLYESILSSTNSGKQAKITEKFLEEQGFDVKMAIISKPHFPFFIYRDPRNKRFYVKIEKIYIDKKPTISTIQYYIDTHADYDLINNYWNTILNDEYKQIEKAYDKLKNLKRR